MTNNRETLNVGARKLKTWREARGIDQSAAAVEVGLPQSTYWEYEAGRKTPGLPNSVKIRDVTGIDGADFLTLNSEPASPDLQATG